MTQPLREPALRSADEDDRGRCPWLGSAETVI